MIYIIRHGQTQENNKRELLGRRDVPLNDEGRRQAERVRQYFAVHGVTFDCVWSSPLTRALQTAEIITGMKPESGCDIRKDSRGNIRESIRSNIREDIREDFEKNSRGDDIRGVIRTDDRLIEMDYGPFEGAKLEDMPPELLDFFADFVHNPAPEGMEQLASVVKRAGEFMEDVARHEEEQKKNLLISTHAIAMKGILEYLTPDSNGSYWSEFLGNCSVYRTEIADGRFAVPVKLL